jgi:hypothetical protein
METDMLIISATMVGIVAMFLLKKRNSKKTLEEPMVALERNHKDRTCRGMGCKDDKWH